MNAHSSKNLPRILRRIFGGLPSSFVIIWLGTLINRAGTFVAPFLTLYLTSKQGVSDSLTALILMSYSAGVVASGLVGGFLADFIGRKKTMILGLTGVAIVQLGLLFSSGVIYTAVFCVLLGVIGDLYRPAASAMVADLVVDEAPRAFGLLHWATNLGVPVASLGAGYFATRSWEWLFAIDAATALIFAALVLWKISETGQVRKPLEKLNTVDEKTPNKVAIRLVAVSGISFLAFTIYFQNTTTLPLRVIDAGHNAGTFGLLLAINGVLIAIAQPLFGPLLSLWDRRLVIAIGLLLTGGGMALSGANGALWFLIFTVVLWSFGEIILAGLLPAVISEMAPPHARGRYLGFFGTSIGLGGVVAPFGILLYRIEPNMLWLACALVPLLLAFAQFRLLRERT